MQNSSPHEFESRYRHVISRSRRRLEQMLDRFGESLYDWLNAALNWPEEDWQADLANFVAHSRMTGIELSEDSLEQIRGLVEARVRGTGVFAEHAHGGSQRGKPTIQLAAITIAPDSDTDSAVDLSEGPQEEVAGPGPETSASFKNKVRTILELADKFVADIWKQKQGTIRVEARNFLQFDHYFEQSRMPLILVVAPHLTARDVALAIITAAYSFGKTPIGSIALEKKLRPGESLPERYRAIQSEAFKQAVAEAAFLAELYYGSIASLNPAGDLIVTVDDISRNGFRWDHLLFALPMMAVFRPGIKRLILKFADGKAFQISSDLLQKLHRLGTEKAKKLIAKAQKAKTKEEALAIIQKGLDSPSKNIPEAPNRPGKPKPRLGPGKWEKVAESMSDRARAYQTQVTGRTGEAYVVATVKFDGYKNGTLIEAKGPGYVNFIAKSDDFYSWFRRKPELIGQAKRQLAAAGGARVDWLVAEPRLKVALEGLFKDNQIHGIHIYHVPAE